MSTRTVWTYSLPSTLLLISPLHMLASLGMDVYLPVVPRMPEILGTNASTIQLTLSLYLPIITGGQLIFGPISDRVGRRPVLLAGTMLFSIASVGLALTSSALPFIALRMIQAIGAAATLVAIFATVRDVFGARSEGAGIYSWLGSVLTFVPAIAPLLGASLDDSLGWRSIFLLMALLGVAAGLQALIRWPETRPVSRPEPLLTNLQAIIVNRQFWVYTLGYAAAMGSFFVYFSTAAGVLINRVGLTPIVFSLIFGTVAVVMIIAARCSSWCIRRWGEQGCLWRGMALLLAGAILLLSAQLWAFPSILGFVGPMWVIAAGICVTTSVTAAGALRPFGHIAGLATAIYSCSQGIIVGVVGTLAVVGLGSDTGWPLVAYCTVLPLATLAFALRYLKPSRK